jgi:hypothetical protein
MSAMRVRPGRAGPAEPRRASGMDETSARAVLLLQAFETVQPASPSWSDEDRAWATRLALQDDAGGTNAEAFIARRARHAVQRLAPREPAAAKWLARRLWHARWVTWAALVGLMLGLLVDSIGASQRINLLAPPLWAVLLWNAVVYALLLGHGLAHLLLRKTRPGGLVRLTQRLLRIGRNLPAGAPLGLSAPASARAMQAFASLWLRCSAPLAGVRAVTLLHAASAALALGLIAGLYVRGLVLDYRAAWESTFLSAGTAHAILAVVLAPAVALSGIALPDAAAFEALRTAHGSSASGAPAAPWIHLLALTLALFVVLPRSALALWGALRAYWLARHVALPLDEPYFERLVRQLRGDVPRVFVLPYATAPGAQAALGLRAVLAPALEDGLQIQIAPTLAYGAEDEPGHASMPPAGTTLAVALFDLTATPQAENQGRFAQQLAAVATTIVLIDEAAFTRRFGADSARLAQRRDAWRVFAESLGTLPVFADLDAPDLAAASRAVQLATRSPVGRATP